MFLFFGGKYILRNILSFVIVDFVRLSLIYLFLGFGGDLGRRGGMVFEGMEFRGYFCWGLYG